MSYHEISIVLAVILVTFIILATFFGTKKGKRFDYVLQLKTMNRNHKYIEKFFRNHPEKIPVVKKFLDENPDVKEKCDRVYLYVSSNSGN